MEWWKKINAGLSLGLILAKKGDWSLGIEESGFVNMCDWVNGVSISLAICSFKQAIRYR